MVHLAQAVTDAAADDPGTGGQLEAALTLTARLRAEVDLTEARLVTTARAAGKTWAEIAAILGLRSRQAAEQRYQRRTRAGADAGEVLPTIEAGRWSPDHAVRHTGPSDAPAGDTRSARGVNKLLTAGPAEITDHAVRHPAKVAVARSAGASVRNRAIATEPVIRTNSDYDLARVGDGYWAVMVDGTKAGTVRRAYEPRALRTVVWEPVTLVGVPVRCLPPAATTSGYARTRDAAALELLGDILRRQRAMRKRRRAARIR